MMTDIRVISTKDELDNFLLPIREANRTIGLVPTMGALHDGHVSLVDQSVKENDFTITTIFVNPTQFNDPEDLEKYPRTLEADVELLKSTGCDVVFAPSVSTVYAEDYAPTKVDLGELDLVMEGLNRPGHFDGVVNVVERFFRLIQPSRAYFGRKDFQQVAVIRHMIEVLDLPIEMVECPTQREPSGLAMSSRNKRLSSAAAERAKVLYQALEKSRSLAAFHSPKIVVDEILDFLRSENVDLEYFQIVDYATLASLEEEWTPGATACIVAFFDGVRLIDNLELVPKTAASYYSN